MVSGSRNSRAGASKKFAPPADSAGVASAANSASGPASSDHSVANVAVAEAPAVAPSRIVAEPTRYPAALLPVVNACATVAANATSPFRASARFVTSAG